MASKKRKKGRRPQAAPIAQEAMGGNVDGGGPEAGVGKDGGEAGEPGPGRNVFTFGDWMKRHPLAQRLVGFVIDYLLCGLLSFLPVMLPYFLMTGGEALADVSSYVPIGVGLPLVALFVLLGVALSWCYYVLVPLRVWPGQTPGKRIVGTEVVMADGGPAGLGALTVRWLAMLFLETLSMTATSFLMQLMALLLGDAAVNAWRIPGLAGNFVSLLLVWRGKAHRPLHDLVAGTWVYADRG